MIKKLKEEISPSELCDGLPPAFGNFISYCRRLELQDTPNYQHCRDIFLEEINKLDEVVDNYFDWFMKKTGKKINKKDYADYKVEVKIPIREKV